MNRAIVLALCAVALALATFSPSALADGDPASDYLVSRQVFLTSQSTSETPSQRQLLSVAQAANRAGFPIRVAIISSDYDLGSITALWRKPRIYARFLGLELSSVYRQRLLVVMPNGFGFNWPGHSTAAAYRVLAKVPAPAGGVALASAAVAGVRQLAAADRVAIPSAPAAGPAASGSDVTDLVLIVAAIVAAIVATVAVTILRRRPRRAPATVTREPSVAGRSALPIRLRWAIPSFALLCGVAVATPILAFSHRQTDGDVRTSAASVVTPPPFSWAAGRRPAPDFVLRDQAGHRVSIGAYRGRPVVVTFVDPLCRNLCPLEAKVLNQVVAQMPPRKRPEILAVSVDVYADARTNLLQDVRKWKLVPQWHWAVGPPAKLAGVWKRYKVGVSVATKRIAGTTIKYILHTEAAYIIDATGHERALFVWPFYPQDVARELRQLT
jgi:cytochrome oxidase Cu insertion factor (SCO1/SenC/PrrC family)